MDSTEERGVQREEDLPERIAGEEERDLDIADRRRKPVLKIPEKAKHLNCDMPCAEEEWRAMPLDIKWVALGILKFSYRGGKSVE